MLPMEKLMHWRSLLLSGLLLAGCGNPTAPSSELLRVTPRHDRLTLQSVTAEPVYYFVIERDFMARALISLCREPHTCPRVPAFGNVNVPHAEIAGYEANSREAVVLHWYLVRDPAGGFRPDSVRSIVAPLR